MRRRPDVEVLRPASEQKVADAAAYEATYSPCQTAEH
jgi:hypothetical protein